MGLWNDFIVPVYNDISGAVSDIVDDVVTALVDITSDVVEGVFSVLGIKDKDVVIVNASTNRLVPEAQRFSIIAPVLRSVIDDTDIPEALLLNERLCVRSSVRSYVKYGELDYVHGLPTTTSAYFSLQKQGVEEVIQWDIGIASTAINTKIWYPDITKYALWYLQENNEYNSTDNQFIYDDKNVDFVSATIEDPSGDIRVTYEYDSVEYDLVELITAPVNEIYYVVDYYRDANPDKDYIWIYRLSDGTWPSLDIEVGGVDSTQMLPIIPLRNAGVSINSDIESDIYITSKEVLNKIGLDLDKYIDEIEGNEHIDNITDVFILFAMNIYSQTPEGMEYWFNLFNLLGTLAEITKEEYDATPTGDRKPFNMYQVSEQKYNALMTYNWITVTIETGVIGDIGEFTSTVTVLDKSMDNEVQSYVTFQNQLNETEYEEIIVYGLFLTTAIFDNATGANVKIVELSTDDVEKTNFVFPVSYQVMDSYDIKQKEVLIYESLCMTSYAVQTIHLEYYQTPEFAAILEVIAVVIFVVTGGLSAGLLAIGEAILIQATLQYLLGIALESAAGDKGKEAVAIILYIIASLKFGGGGKGFDLTSATDLLFAAQVLTGAFTTKLGIDSGLLQDEMDAFELEAESAQERLDELEEGIYNKTGTNPLFLATSFINDFYETPDNFYQRTAHTANPGVLALDEIHTYVDNALVLPELDDTFA